MTIPAILYTILITPLQLFFEVVFSFAQRFTDNPGLSIIVLSLTVNFLVLPLYKRADAIQAEQRELEKKMQPGVSHIKKMFSGDERMMILNTYYRQNNYKPVDVFKESISLLLQIPFFIAAYRFLSNLALLNGTAFGPITDLGRPDALISFGVISINLLPVLMTAFNIISCLIYTRGLPLKSKVQLYAMALFFLVFLYNSPSGLVFYWTLNNLFSLLKNVFFKLENPGKVLSVLFSAVGLMLVLYAIFFFDNTVKRRAIVVLLGMGCQLPLLISVIRSSGKSGFGFMIRLPEADRKLFILSGVLLTLLIGGLIPSAVIKSSPQEFVFIMMYQNPVWYVVYAMCIAFGAFVVWMGVFYSIADKNGRSILEMILWVFCGISAVDFMFFGTDLGTLMPTLQFRKDLVFSLKDTVLNALVLLFVILLLFIVRNRSSKAVQGILLTVIMTLMVMLIINIGVIQKSVYPIEQSLEERQKNYNYNFSKNGKNVVVLMLDRALGPYIPYIFNEIPELEKKFDGFTYYSNTMSFGGKTNFGTPAIFGGYEYSPTEINRRSDISLKDKQNEALKIMPYLFDDNGFDVTVSDPPYANYQWIPDVSIYSERPEIKAFTTNGMADEMLLSANISNNRRNFFFYALMKAAPVFMQKYIYNGGIYLRLAGKDDVETIQTTDGFSKANGLDITFMSEYRLLDNMDKLTGIKNNSANSFHMITNDATHDPIILQEPEYKPSENVDNTDYDLEHMDRFTVNGRTMKMENEMQFAHYETNAGCMIKLGEWFDYLRDNDIYDNTRIILVSDHGERLNQFDELMLDYDDAEGYSCLLMVKDFDSHGFSESDEFMTTADVPTIAMKGIISDPVNPFTGNSIDNSEKTAHDQYITTSWDWDTAVNNGNQFLPSNWLAVKDNIWDKNNWRLVAKDAVFMGEE